MSVKYLKDLVLGKVRYWDKTSSAALKELARRLESTKSPDCLILKCFLSSAEFVVESLFGPLPPWLSGLNYQRGSMRPIHFDVRRISISQLHQLYCILLIYFVFVYFKTNRFAPDELKKSLFEATGRPDFAGGFLDSLEMTMKIHIGSVGEQEIKAERWMAWRLHQKVWQEVVRVVGLLDDAKPESLHYFMTISESAYKDGLQDIQAQLNL